MLADQSTLNRNCLVPRGTGVPVSEYLILHARDEEIEILQVYMYHLWKKNLSTTSMIFFFCIF